MSGNNHSHVLVTAGGPHIKNITCSPVCLFALWIQRRAVWWLVTSLLYCCKYFPSLSLLSNLTLSAPAAKLNLVRPPTHCQSWVIGLSTVVCMVQIQAIVFACKSVCFTAAAAAALSEGKYCTGDRTETEFEWYVLLWDWNSLKILQIAPSFEPTFDPQPCFYILWILSLPLISH